MRRVPAVALLTLALLSGGCSDPPGPAPVPASSTSASTPAGASTPGSASPSNGTPPDATPANTTPSKPGTPSVEPQVGTDQRFGLNDTAQFDDGLEVEIAGSSGAKADTGDRGAESTGGQIVVASVRIENDTRTTYDPRPAVITARYGDQLDAAPVTDPAIGLTGTFTDVIAAGDEGVAAVEFAIPARELGRVSFVVDLHDADHDPMSFTGRVERG